MTTDVVLFSKDHVFPSGLSAIAVYVSACGEVTIVTKGYSPKIGVPVLDTRYLEAMCSRFYYGGRDHRDAIADVMLLNGFLRRSEYDSFYAALNDNMMNRRLTIVSSQMCQ